MDWICSYLPMLHCPILSISIPGTPGSFPACAISYSVYKSFWYKFLSISWKALNPSKAFSVVVERARTCLGSHSLTFNRWDTYTYFKEFLCPLSGMIYWKGHGYSMSLIKCYLPSSFQHDLSVNLSEPKKLEVPLFSKKSCLPSFCPRLIFWHLPTLYFAFSFSKGIEKGAWWGPEREAQPTRDRRAMSL